MINLLSKTNDFVKNINLFNKHMILEKTDKFGNKTWKGVISEKKIFPLVCSKYLSSWTGLDRSGHVRSQSCGQISHVSGPTLTCCLNF